MYVQWIEGDNYYRQTKTFAKTKGKKMKLSVKQMAVSLLLSMTIATGASAAPATPVSKQERVLVILSELDSTGNPDMRDFYRVLDDLTNHMTRAILQDKYRQIVMLDNQRATLPNFKKVLYDLAKNPTIRAIDVIVSLHGSPDHLSFAEGAYSKVRVRDFILETASKPEKATQIQLKKKLRALYNLACFAGKDMEKMRDLSFAVVNGAKGVNANSEVELVPALTAWANGVGFKNSFAGSNNPLALAIFDEPIRIAGRVGRNSLQYVNSEKVFLGEGNITINSSAN